MARVTNKCCRPLVEAKRPFNASNLFAEWYDNRYIVYSYGKHFPMYIWDNTAEMWFGNSDKYSLSTSKQQGQARPYDVEIQWHDTKTMRSIAIRGFVDTVARRMKVPDSESFIGLSLKELMPLTI